MNTQKVLSIFFTLLGVMTFAFTGMVLFLVSRIEDSVVALKSQALDASEFVELIPLLA